jgi:tRNA(fMet)-specific endonuclease VapC
LLDTALCLHVVRERSPWLLAKAEHVRAGDAALSVLTWGLLQYGASRSTRRLAALPLLDELAGLLPILPVPREAGIAYRDARSRLDAHERLGAPCATPAEHDLWLMAHARAARLALVTHDARRFPPLPGLRVVRWAEP